MLRLRAPSLPPTLTHVSDAPSDAAAAGAAAAAAAAARRVPLLAVTPAGQVVSVPLALHPAPETIDLTGDPPVVVPPPTRPIIPAATQPSTQPSTHATQAVTQAGVAVAEKAPTSEKFDVLAHNSSKPASDVQPPTTPPRASTPPRPVTPPPIIELGDVPKAHCLVNVTMPSLPVDCDWKFPPQPHKLQLVLQVDLTARELKHKLEARTGMPVHKQKLKLRGKFLKDFHPVTTATDAQKVVLVDLGVVARGRGKRKK